MSKALDLLKTYGKHFNYHTADITIGDIEEAIAELESMEENLKSLTNGVMQNRQKFWESLKPKNCTTCKFSFYWECADVLECSKMDKQRCYDCEKDLDTIEVTGDFCCNRYEPKEA